MKKLFISIKKGIGELKTLNKYLDLSHLVYDTFG